MEEQRSSDARAGISVAVCEPNENLRDEMAAMIAKEKPEARIGTFASGDEILRSEEDFAIYFLDVQGADGLEAAREIRARERGGAGSVIVFVTGYRDYMEEAFDVHAFQYLVKPVDGKKFAEVLCAAWAEAEATRRREGRHILLKLDGITRKVALRDILYLEAPMRSAARWRRWRPRWARAFTAAIAATSSTWRRSPTTGRARSASKTASSFCWRKRSTRIS